MKEVIDIDERIAAAQKAVAKYQLSKFNSAGMFASYWIAATICDIDGHRPAEIPKPHYIPICSRCDSMVHPSDKLAIGYTYPKAPDCPGCWRDRS